MVLFLNKTSKSWYNMQYIMVSKEISLLEVLEWIQNSEKHNSESYKTAKTKQRIYKRAQWQNSEYTKQQTYLQNGESYKDRGLNALQVFCSI